MVAPSPCHSQWQETIISFLSPLPSDHQPVSTRPLSPSVESEPFTPFSIPLT